MTAINFWGDYKLKCVKRINYATTCLMTDKDVGILFINNIKGNYDGTLTRGSY